MTSSFLHFISDYFYLCHSLKHGCVRLLSETVTLGKDGKLTGFCQLFLNSPIDMYLHNFIMLIALLLKGRNNLPIKGCIAQTNGDIAHKALITRTTHRTAFSRT